MKIENIDTIRRLIQIARRESDSLGSDTVHLLLGMTLEELDSLASAESSVIGHEQVRSEQHNAL